MWALRLRLIRHGAAMLPAGAVVAACFGFEHPRVVPDDAGACASQCESEGGAGGTGPSAGAGAENAGGGGEAGTPTELEPLVILTSELPAATFKLDYELSLEAEGGTTRGYRWTLGKGRFPGGLELTPNGSLHGTPMEAGTFAIEVAVEDSGGTTATRDFTLTVVGRRWLVYRSDEQVTGVDLLYAVDLTSLGEQEPRKVELGSLDYGPGGPRSPAGLIPGRYGIPEPRDQAYAFSPDGRWLAQVDSAFDLYVREMSSEVPSEPIFVAGTVTDFDWSPNSESLVFLTATGVAFADVSGAGPLEAGPISELGFTSVSWVTDTLVAFATTELTHVARRTASGFEPPQQLPFTGYLWKRWPSLETGLFGTNSDGCGASWNLVDFGLERRRAHENLLQVSPDTDHVANLDGTTGYVLYPAWDLQSPPIAQIATGRYCAFGAWSHDGTLFGSAGADFRFHVVDAGAAPANTTTIAGDYEVQGEYVPPAFSRDDRWLAFPTLLDIYVAQNVAGSFGPALSISPRSAPSYDGLSIFQFAPNARALAFGELPNVEGDPDIGGVFLVDLGGSVPKSPVPAGSDEQGRAVHLVSWSDDSTKLAYTRDASPFPAPRLLYVVDLLDPESLRSGGRAKLITPASCVGEATCRMATSFAFQP